MAIAGMNIRANVWRYTYSTDDAVGGANPTGTVVYSRVWMRMEQDEPEKLLQQQGIETTKMFTATAVPATLDIREHDEIVVVLPKDHYYYNERFRIMGVRPASLVPRDPRNYLILNLVRSERAHTIQ